MGPDDKELVKDRRTVPLLDAGKAWGSGRVPLATGGSGEAPGNQGLSGRRNSFAVVYELQLYECCWRDSGSKDGRL